MLDDGIGSFLPGLLEVVNDHLLSDRFEDFLDELQMQRVHLVIVLRLFAGEHDIERDLIRLVHHWAMARYHLADMKMNDARDRRQILLRTRDEFVRGLGLGWGSPKNHDMGEHAGSVSTSIRKYNHVCGEGMNTNEYRRRTVLTHRRERSPNRE